MIAYVALYLIGAFFVTTLVLWFIAGETAWESIMAGLVGMLWPLLPCAIVLGIGALWMLDGIERAVTKPVLPPANDGVRL